MVPVIIVLGLVRLQVLSLASRLLFWRLLDLESRWQLALLHQSLLKQVVDCRHLVVLVAIQTLGGIVLLESVAFEISEKRGLDWNLVLPYDETLALADWLVRLVPRVSLYLLRCVSLVGVGLQNLVY